MLGSVKSVKYHMDHIYLHLFICKKGVCVPTVLEGRVTFLSFGNVEKIVSLT